MERGWLRLAEETAETVYFPPEEISNSEND
jgi:hypothetical protein